MAHHKLNEDDDNFLQVPQDATLIFAGLGGTETWIERAEDSVVRIGVKSVGVATSGGGALEVCVAIGGDTAKGQDRSTPSCAPAKPCRCWSRRANASPSRPIQTPPASRCCAPWSGRPTWFPITGASRSATARTAAATTRRRRAEAAAQAASIARTLRRRSSMAKGLVMTSIRGSSATFSA
jgi:hypothetical protein